MLKSDKSGEELTGNIGSRRKRRQGHIAKVCRAVGDKEREPGDVGTIGEDLAKSLGIRALLQDRLGLNEAVNGEREAVG